MLNNRLPPPVNVALSAPLVDSHERGLLESTLVLAEFGRTPHFGQLLRNAATTGGTQGSSRRPAGLQPPTQTKQPYAVRRRRHV